VSLCVLSICQNLYKITALRLIHDDDDNVRVLIAGPIPTSPVPFALSTLHYLPDIDDVNESWFAFCLILFMRFRVFCLTRTSTAKFGRIRVAFDLLPRCFPLLSVVVCCFIFFTIFGLANVFQSIKILLH